MRIRALLFLIWLPVAAFAGAETVSLTESDRDDGRFANTRAVVQNLMENRKPALAFNPNFSREEFYQWKERVGEKMAELMKCPIEGTSSPTLGLQSRPRPASGAMKRPAELAMREQPAPKMISDEQRDGYRLQKWECYPLPACVSPFLVLIPDGASEQNPAPAVLCIPGSGQSKESAASEASGNFPGGMAYQFAKAGFVAVAVDNPCIGEASDLERGVEPERDYDYENSSRFLLELGWSYQGYASFIDKRVLEWLKARDDVRWNRIFVCGFSLGTETLMVLGVQDNSIFGFIYNDFLCRTRERALAMSTPGADGRRHFPNSIRHLTPGFLTQFDFPDLVAALAPQPVLCTEGGMDRDFELVKKAYEIAGAKGAATCLHQPKYADPKDRIALEKVPYGIDRETFFRYANVDPQNHYFKGEIAIPWAKEMIARVDSKERLRR